MLSCLNGEPYALLSAGYPLSAAVASRYGWWLRIAGDRHR